MNIEAGEDGCSGKTWRIVLDRFDWERRSFSIVQSIITTPLELSGQSGRILSAYDPDVAEFGGKYWVAFECIGDNIPGTSTCIASMKLDDKDHFELLDAYIIIAGESSGPGYQYTAADPKFLNFKGHLYLYWTAIKKLNHTWISISTRGTELMPSAKSARGRLWAKGAGQATSSYDYRTNSEVWRGADMMSLREIDGTIYTTASSAVGSCLTPSTEQEGCFRLLISKSCQPLGQDTFSRDLAPEDRLPTTGQEYARFITAPDGQLMILGHFVPHKLESFMRRPVLEGMTEFPVDLKALFAR